VTLSSPGIVLVSLCLAALPSGAELGGSTDDQPQQPVVRRGADEALGQERTAESLALDLPDPYGDERVVRLAIERGLAFLAKEQAQEPDGSFPPTGAAGPAPVAVTALAALAYMSTGSCLGRGPHGRELARALDYLLSRVDRDPTSRTRGYISDPRDKNSRTHGHGFATLALAEAYTVSPTTERGARLAEAVELAVRCIESSQGAEGGWYYSPVRGLEHEGSVTIALVQALRAAKSAGVRIDRNVVAKAVGYVKRSQKDDGSFRYALGSEQTSVALTAAAISTLNATGKYHGPEIVQGYDYIERELRARDLRDRTAPVLKRNSFPYYERLYLAQAYWQNADRSAFDDWAILERRRVIREQNEDGSWGGSKYGDAYATAVNLLFLSLPSELLPIFQR